MLRAHIMEMDAIKLALKLSGVNDKFQGTSVLYTICF